LNVLTNIKIWAALQTAEKFCCAAELKNANMLVAQSSHKLFNYMAKGMTYWGLT
jgi:hypothetical protein